SAHFFKEKSYPKHAKPQVRAVFPTLQIRTANPFQETSDPYRTAGAITGGGRGAGFGVPPCLRCAFLLVAWCFGGVWWWFDVARGVFFWPCVWRGRACVLGVCVGRVCAGGGVFCPGATTWARARGGHGRGVDTGAGWTRARGGHGRG